MPGWQTLQTEHFTVHTAVPRDVEDDLPLLEYQYGALKKFFRGADLPRLEIVSMDGGDLNHLLGQNRAGVVMTASPGASPIGKHGLIVTSTGRSAGSLTPLLAHLFIAQQFPKAPLWLHEGLATYLGAARVLKKGYCYGSIAHSKEPTIPLARLFSMSWAGLDEKDARFWYRDTAHYFVHMIIHDEPGPIGHRMAALLDAVAAGRSQEDLLEATFPGVPLDALQRMLDAKVTRLRDGPDPYEHCPLMLGVPPYRDPSGPIATTSDSPRDQLAVLFKDLERLPARYGFQPWYPPEVMASVR